MSDGLRSGRGTGDPTRFTSSGGSGGVATLPSGTRLDNRFTIDSVIAAGGFGITYLGHHEALRYQCAIKEHFPRQFAARDGQTGRVTATDEGTFRWALDRFLEEGRTLVRVRHPNVVGVKDIFEANGTAYLVLDYEEGMSVKTWLDRLGRPPTQGEFDRLLRPLLDALEYVHAQGLMHRDLAPDNILIRNDGSPVLIDFGSARQAIAERSQVLSAIIKSGFSPPEQYTTDGRAQGPWTDIYALAATIFRAVTGGPPPEATNRASGIEMPLLEDDATLRSRYRPGFLAAIDHALRLRTVERPQSIAAWRPLLLDTAGTAATRPATFYEPGQAPPTIKPPPVTLPPSRPATFTQLPDGRSSAPPQGTSPLKIVAGVVIGLLVAGAGLGTYLWQRSSSETIVTPIQPKTTPKADPKQGPSLGNIPLSPPDQPRTAPQTPPQPQQPQTPPQRASGDPARQIAPGSRQVFRDSLSNGSACGFCPELVVAPAGRFQMGSPTSEPAREGWLRGVESPQVTVNIPSALAVGRYSVTFDEWDACVNDGGCNAHRPGDNGWGRGNRPVINVSWQDAKAYIDWLSRKTGRAYRLPSEAEREYFTRAGTVTPFWFGVRLTINDANYDGSTIYDGGGERGIFRERTVPVNSFRPNPWGLFNVHGNVWEWAEDCWNASHQGHAGSSVPRLQGDCNQRVRRGGAWLGIPTSIRAAQRAFAGINDRKNELGFRVVRNIGN